MSASVGVIDGTRAATVGQYAGRSSSQESWCVCRIPSESVKGKPQMWPKRLVAVATGSRSSGIG